MTPSVEDRVQAVLEEHLAAQVGLDPDSFTVQSVENGVLSLKLHPGCMG
jgi:hypothetical protein